MKVNIDMENLSNAVEIAIGEGLLNQNIKTYTIQEYINKQISDIMNNKKFKTEIKDRWGEKSLQEVSFDEFIKQSFDASKEVKHQLENYMKSVKDDINRNIKNVTDQVMKDMLSNTIFDILMQSDTYSKISSGLKLLGDNK